MPGDRTGRPTGSGRLLTGEQEQHIQEAIEAKSPQELGVTSALWTRQAVQELIERGHDADLTRRVARMVDRNEYKRRQAAPGVRVSPKAFGKDRRLPITNRWPG